MAALGLNRQNDTPIGGLEEFRGNLQGGDVFSVGEVPVFDGEKFVPGANSAIVLGYGGLVENFSAGRIADGSIMGNWDGVMPLFGTPLQMTPDLVTGVITIDQSGVYDINWQGNIGSLANNEDYFFELVIDGGPTTFGAHVVGSNNVSTQSSGFNLLVEGNIGGLLGIRAGNAGSNTFDVVSMSFTCTKIG